MRKLEKARHNKKLVKHVIAYAIAISNQTSMTNYSTCRVINFSKSCPGTRPIFERVPGDPNQYNLRRFGLLSLNRYVTLPRPYLCMQLMILSLTDRPERECGIAVMFPRKLGTRRPTQFYCPANRKPTGSRVPFATPIATASNNIRLMIDEHITQRFSSLKNIYFPNTVFSALIIGSDAWMNNVFQRIVLPEL